MNKLMSHSPRDILRHAQSVANYYGFLSFSSLVRAQNIRPTRKPYPSNIVLEEFDSMAQLTISFLKRLRDSGLHPSIQQPLLVWHTNITPGRIAPRQSFIQFHMIGVSRVIAETVLIHTAYALINDLYKTTPSVRINSAGDKETRVRFIRELEQYFNKNSAELPSECVAQAHKDMFSGAEALIARNCVNDIPSSVNVLSESSRKHLEGFLEFLEETKMPYTLAPELITRGNIWSETCFEIQVQNERVAWGSRYEDITGNFFETKLPSAVIIIRPSVNPTLTPAIRVEKHPRFIFIHIGVEAKRISIVLAEEFRKASLPLLQMIGIESLTEQLRIVDTLNPEYLIIMGRKEALEEMVILRKCVSHTETIIPLGILIDTIKTYITDKNITKRKVMS